jgi:hypothetical protein
VTYLRGGLGLLAVDVVTSRTGDLHTELIARLPTSGVYDEHSPLFAAAYRPVAYDGQSGLDIWRELLELDRPLPTLPLWLRDGLCLPVDLEATYERTRDEYRLGDG